MPSPCPFSRHPVLPAPYPTALASILGFIHSPQVHTTHARGTSEGHPINLTGLHSALLGNPITHGPHPLCFSCHGHVNLSPGPVLSTALLPSCPSLLRSMTNSAMCHSGFYGCCSCINTGHPSHPRPALLDPHLSLLSQCTLLAGLAAGLRALGTHG